MRIDEGHVTKEGKPFDKPSAAVPHVHGYNPDKSPIRDPTRGDDKHFPLENQGDPKDANPKSE